MSIYLLAFIISDLKTISKRSSKYNILVEVTGRKDLIDNGDGDYALDEAARILDFYSDYFGIKYQLPKSSTFKHTFENLKMIK